MRICVLGLLLSVVAISRAVSQRPEFENVARARATLRLAAGTPALARAAFALPVARRRSHKRDLGETLMVVGGIAFLSGVIAGGDAGTVLIAGGLVTAGYGLYLYEGRSP